MSDVADDAQAREAQFLAAALERARQGVQTPGLGYLMLDGLAHCRECEEPVPMARVQAAPDSGLCVACQREKEREAGR